MTDTSTYAISLESIQAAARRIDGLAHRTPVVTCSALDAAASANADGIQVRLFFKVTPQSAQVSHLRCLLTTRT
jgi:hypothetical protein